MMLMKSKDYLSTQSYSCFGLSCQVCFGWSWSLFWSVLLIAACPVLLYGCHDTSISVIQSVWSKMLLSDSWYLVVISIRISPRMPVFFHRSLVKHLSSFNGIPVPQTLSWLASTKVWLLVLFKSSIRCVFWQNFSSIPGAQTSLTTSFQSWTPLDLVICWFLVLFHKLRWLSLFLNLHNVCPLLIVWSVYLFCKWCCW